VNYNSMNMSILDPVLYRMGKNVPLGTTDKILLI
jgi:hypothetical protein